MILAMVFDRINRLPMAGTLLLRRTEALMLLNSAKAWRKPYLRIRLPLRMNMLRGFKEKSHRRLNAYLPNPALNSDPACIAFRSLSASRFLGSAQRLGAGGAG